MPTTINAPSNVMPVVADPPPYTTESKSAFVDYQAIDAPTARPYVGVLSAPPAGVVNETTVLAQLESIGARLTALKKTTAPAPAPAPAAPSSVVPAPWESFSYDTFAQFAGEASRVRDTGRLPFGSDNKKMAL